jgi:molecular chaperone GrpE
MSTETNPSEPRSGANNPIHDNGAAEPVEPKLGAPGVEAAGAFSPDSQVEEAVDYAAIVAELEAALAAERARADDLLEKSQRMAAEFQNSRRRQERQLAEEIERAGSHFVRRLLPIVDDFDLAFANVPPGIDADAGWIEGFRQIQKKLHTLLEEEGVQAIPVEGEFDPALHEAVISEPSDSTPSGHVIAALRAGYTHKGRVLRPALVRVAT